MFLEGYYCYLEIRYEYYIYEIYQFWLLQRKTIIFSFLKFILFKINKDEYISKSETNQWNENWYS